MSPEMRKRWERARRKQARTANGKGEEMITIRLERALFRRFMALAKKKRLDQDELIARGLLALLAAEGE